jgi:hypothetical protein
MCTSQKILNFYLLNMSGGHKSKKAWQSCNINRPSLIISETSSRQTPPWSQAPSPNSDKSDLEEDDELDLLIHFDSLKTQSQYEDECLDDAEQLDETVTKNTQKPLSHRLKDMWVLDSCPKEAIQWFTNQLWRFIDSYNKGLTRDTTIWLVYKQKGHQSVSESVKKALDA